MTTAEFGGVIGRDWRDSTPWWPPEPHPPDGAPNVAARRARRRRLRAARLLRLRHRHADDRPAGGRRRAARQLPHHRAVLAHPLLPAHRAQPPPQRHGPASPTSPSAIPATAAGSRSENGFLSEMLGDAGYAHLRGRQVAPHARRRGAHGGAARVVAARARASTAGTASTAARRTSSRPRSTTTTTRSPRRGRSRTATTSARTWPTRPSSSSPTSARSTPTSRSSSTSPPARATRPTTRRPSGSSGTAAASTAGWDVWRDETFARQHELGLLPPRHRVSRRARRGCRRGTSSSDDDRRGGGALHGVLRRLPLLHRRPDRPRARLPRGAGRARQHPRRRRVRQRRQRGRRSRRLDQRRPHGNLDPAGPDELRRRIDEIGGPSAHNNYPWGWTMAGNTPFRRWKREVHEGGVADPCIVHWPAPLRRERRAIRHQFAHAVDVMPTVLELAGIEAPERIDDVAQAPIDGHELRLPARRTARTSPSATRPSTSRCSARARSTTTAGRR